MEPNVVVFDASRIVAVNFKTADGIKTVRVRFPSDEELTARQKRCKVIVKQLGRQTSTTTVTPMEDLDYDLAMTLRPGDKDAVQIDKFEAAKIVETLSLAKVTDVREEPGGYAVDIRVPGGKVTHHLKMPMEADKAEFRRAFANVVDLPYGQQSITINLAVADPIYQRLMASVDGYANAIPIIHKSAALKAVIDASDSIAAEESEDF